MKQTNNEHIILGIDPGTSIMGYGILKKSWGATQKSSLDLLQYGVIHLSKYQNLEVKLKKIFDRVLGLINDYSPDEVALEAPFFGKNVQSMLKLGRAQGVAMAAALSCQIPIKEYAPRKVKQAVTGNGNASKEQVAQMLHHHLIIPQTEAGKKQLHDATDAVAVALCHHFQNNGPFKNPGSWKAFLKNNPGRIK